MTARPGEESSSADRLRMLLDLAADGIFHLDTTGRCLDVNRRGAEMLGWSRDEIIGRHAGALVPAAERAERPLIFPELAVGDVRRTDRMLRTAAGHSFAAEIQSTRMPDGTLQCIVRDVSARRAEAREREELIAELRAALARVRTLQGLIPICAGCKSIREDSGYWRRLETYLAERSDVEFSHGLCPACAERWFPDTGAMPPDDAPPG